jgi:mannose-6-phosphate isomerase-like protein (cupin superfamily)
MSHYDDWLAASRRNDAMLAASPVVARGDSLDWHETVQDHQVALLIARQVGFPTQGTHLARATIPIGHHSGTHRHGEEALHVLRGSGVVVLDDVGYGFRAGSTIHVPYQVAHRLVNTGTEEVAYISASAIDLDLYAVIGRLEQLAPKGTDVVAALAGVRPAASDSDREGRRIVLDIDEVLEEHDRRTREHGHQRSHSHGAVYPLMGGGESGTSERRGFTAKSVAMTAIFEEVPNTSSHKHIHTEAMLYVLEGSGYSEIDGQRYDWMEGDAVHVPPRMTTHEHFNPSSTRTRTLRIEFGIRSFYEALWSGYHKVELEVASFARHA